MEICPAYQGLIAEPASNNETRETPNVHHAVVLPTPVHQPKWIAWSETVAKSLQIEKSEKWLQVLSGNQVLEDIPPIATRYGGHQFGHWAGQLGDGRAITLAEITGQEVQLKGAGPTPYSRFADGRAVLRSSLREYICSEAMHHLNVPTTRALALVTTGETVIRDMFYDGHPKAEPGAIVTRVAPSFLRFGHFEIHAAYNEKELLQQLFDYTLKRYYPGRTPDEFFQELCDRTAQLIVEWYRVGFVHGVMNTDNMSILGLTIDYGPFGFLDAFDLNWTPNTTDLPGRRYAFGQQPNVALWNLSVLASTLHLLGLDFQKPLEGFSDNFLGRWEKMMAQKLGLKGFQQNLVQEIHAIFQLQEIDMTIFYRLLIDCLEDKPVEHLLEAFYKAPEENTVSRLGSWFAQWKKTISQEGLRLDEAREAMGKVNPVFIPRNYQLQMVIDELEQGKDDLLQKMETAMQKPYEMNDCTRLFFQKRPDWARNRAGCSSLSCSS